MGYLFLALSLIAGSTKGYCGKQTSGYVNEYKDAMLANTIRMGFCIIIGFIMIAAQGNIGLLKISPLMLLLTAMSGITTSVFVVCWLISVKKGAYMMLDVFLMLGVMVPLLGSSMMFGETIKLTQWIGLAVLLAAVIIMCSYNNSIKEKISVSSFVLLVICGVANGLTDFSQKLFVKLCTDSTSAVFNFYTYVFSAAVLVGCYFAFKGKSGEGAAKANFKPIFVYILIMSVCLFANSYFKTIAAHYLSSAQLYPLAQGSSLILSSIMSATLFHEKLTLKCIIGIVLSFAALIIINVL